MKKNEKKNMLAKACPITRRWLVSIKEEDVDSATINKFNFLNIVERNIYTQWHQQCLAEMKRIKLNACVPELYSFVADPKVNLDKALSVAQKSYAREENKTKQKHIGKMVSMLQTLHRNEKKLYKEATQALLNGEPETCLEDIAMAISNENEVANEYMLYTKQSIKHYNRLLKLGKQPSIHELYQALDPRSATNPNVHTAQVNIVAGTYKEGEDVPTDIKDICFEYIKESIRYAGYFHVILMEYIFKNDEISERAYNLFVETEAIIRKSGMSVMPKMYANRLAKKLGLYAKEVTELTDSDIRILRIEEMFSSK